MAGRSSITRHPKRDAIEAALLRGDTNAQVAEEFGIPNQVVSRYRRSATWQMLQKTLALEKLVPGVDRSKVPGDLERVPDDLEKARAYALHRMHGHSQGEAAALCGLVKRTVQFWEAAAWWPALELEVEQKFFQGLRRKAMSALSTFTGKDPATARFVGERLCHQLRLPRQVEIVGDPIEKLAVALVGKEEAS